MNPFERTNRVCNSTGCKNPALFIPVVKIWAKGFKKTANNAMVAELSVQFCQGHRDCVKSVYDIFSKDDIDSIFMNVTRISKKAPPDLDSIQLEWNPLIVI